MPGAGAFTSRWFGMHSFSNPSRVSFQIKQAGPGLSGEPCVAGSYTDLHGSTSRVKFFFLSIERR